MSLVIFFFCFASHYYFSITVIYNCENENKFYRADKSVNWKKTKLTYIIIFNWFKPYENERLKTRLFLTKLMKEYGIKSLNLPRRYLSSEDLQGYLPRADLLEDSDGLGVGHPFQRLGVHWHHLVPCDMQVILSNSQGGTQGDGTNSRGRRF